MSQKLSTSTTFRAVSAQLKSLEDAYLNTLTPTGIVNTLGYTPANITGATFTGPVFSDVFSCRSYGSAGGIQFSRAFSAGFTGIVEFSKSNGTRNGFVGFNPENGPMHYGSDTGAGHFFEGGIISPDPAMHFGLRFNSVDGILDFDTNDYLYYSRSENTFLFNIAGSTKATIDSNGVIGATQFQADANAYFYVSGGTVPRLVFDNGDALQFDRASNALNTYIAGSARLTVNPVGTFVANVFTVGDGNFGMSLNGGSPYVAFDNADFLGYNRSSNVFSFNVGNANKAQIDGFGNLSTAGFIYPSSDSNFWLGLLSGPIPAMNFDAGDFLQYDRGADKFYFVIGGVNVASIDASGNMRLKGTLTQSVTP